MPKKFWWPGRLPAQRVLVQNFLAKITTVGPQIGLSPAQIADAVAVCQAFIGAVNAAAQAKSTMKAMTQWRDQVLNGPLVGEPSPQPPVFPVVGIVNYSNGVVKQFFALRELILAMPGYNTSLGEDLGLIGSEKAGKFMDNTTPELRSVNVSGNSVSLSGSMQGFDAMRVEYAPKNGAFRTVAFLTNLPATFQIDPVSADNAEIGHIRSVFIKRNNDFGNFTPNHPITLLRQG